MVSLPLVLEVSALDWPVLVWLPVLDWPIVDEPELVWLLELPELLGEDEGVLCATIQAVQPNKVIVSKIFLVMATLLVFWFR